MSAQDGNQEEFNRYLVYRRPEGLFTVPQGKNFVWFNPNPKDPDSYDTGEVKSESGDELTVVTGDGHQYTVKKKFAYERNPAKFDGVEDCAELGYLNEACVLHNLRIRYDSDVIHTYSGLFLVVLNPYKRFPIYNKFTIDHYRGRRRNEEPPHVYAVADEAYRAMLNEHQNQSILITGESGAGKTENTKKVIQYLTAIAGKSEAGELEQQLLQANPVLESFGNACTVRNNNSSRFGKFIEIQFNSSGYIVGASINSYLLEKSRVVGQALGERNFHIFYQLLAGADKEMAKQLRLKPASEFNYVNQGKNYNIEGTDDGEDFKELCKGLALYGIDEDDQFCIWRIIAGLLHLGNAELKEGASGAELVDQTSLAFPAELLGVNETNLRKGLIEPRIKAGTDWVSQHLSKDKALASRDALAKAIYHRLFLWLIKKINETMAQPRRAFFIGVLDIAGFEIFKHNSFEQLCINYTNEKLQQFFNHHMFKLEQEEYMREKIEWNFIDFGLDCQPVIDLIEQKAPPGILALLDEQSVFPSATDDSFLRLLNSHFGKGRGHPKFREDRFGKPEVGIEHYAGLVTYTITDWIEKNRDPLQRDLDRCMKESKYNFIARLFKEDLGAGGGILVDDLGGGAGGASPFGVRKKAAMFVTVGSQHKEQLATLMNMLYLTNPHFVRCILPNNEKKQHCLQDALVLDQLRCNGVLEGIRITRKGYPNRVLYADFLKRYYFLGKGIPRTTADVKPTVITLVKQIGLTEDKYAIGLTKIFFRTGALAWIEEQREEKLSKLIVGIQAAARAYLARARYAELKETTVSAIIIQQNLRAYLEFKNWAWWKLFQKVRPLLKRRNFEKEIQDKDSQIKDLNEKLSAEEANRQKLEAAMKVAEGQIGDLTAQLKTTRDDLERMGDQKDALEGDKHVLELKMEDLKEEIEDRKEDIETLKAKIAQSDLKYQELEDSLAAEQKQRNAVEKTAKRLEQELDELRKEKEDNLEHISTLDKLKASLQAEIDDLTSQVEQEVQARNTVERQKRKLEDELDSVQASLAGESDQKGEALKAKKAVEQELANTQKMLDAANTTIEQQKAQLEKLQKAIEDLKAELDKETQARQQLEAACKKLKAELQDAKDECDDLAREKAVLEQRLKRNEDDLKELQEQLDDKVDGAAILESERNKKDAELTELRKRISEVEGQVAKYEKEKKDLSRQVAEAQTLIETLEHEKQTLLNNKKALEEKVEDRNIAFANLDKDKQNTDRARKKAEQDLRDAQTKIEELEAQNKSLADKVKDSDSQIKELQDELDQNEEARNANEKRKKALETDLALAQSQVEDARKAQAMTDKRKKDIEDELNQLQAEFDAADEEHKKALSDLRARDAELEEARRKLATESSDKEKALGQNKVLMQTNEHLRHDAEEAELAAQALQREKKKLQEDLDEALEKLDLEGKQRRNQEAAKKRAEADLRNAKAQLEQQAQQYSELSVQAKASKEEADQMRKELDEMDEKMAALRNDQKKNALETQQHKEMAESSASALAKAQSRVQTLEARVAELEADLESRPDDGVDSEMYKKKAAEAEEVRNQLKAESEAKAAAEKAKNDLRKELLEAKGQLEVEAQARQGYEQLKKRLQDEMTELRQELEASQRNTRGLQDKVKAQEAEIKSLRDQIAAPTGADEEELNRMKALVEQTTAELEAERKNSGELAIKIKSQEQEVQDAKMQIDAEVSSKEHALKLKKQLEDDIAQLNEQIAEEQERANTADDAMHKAQLEAEDWRKKYEAQSGSLEMGEQSRQALEKELEKYRSMYEEERKTRAEFERVKKRLEGDVEELTVRLEGEVGGKSNLDRAKRKFERDLRVTKSALDAERAEKAELQAQLAKVEEDVDELRMKFDREVKARTILERAKTALEAKVSDMQDLLETEAKNRTRADRDKRDMQARLDEATQLADEAEEAKNEIQEQMEKIAAERDDLRKELERERDAKDDLEDQKAKTAREVLELRGRIEEMASTQSNLEKTKKRLESELDENTKALERELKNKVALNKSLKNQERQLAEAKKRVTELEAVTGKASQIAKLETDLRKANNRLQETTEELEKLQSEKKILDKEHAQTVAELEEERRQHKRLKSRLNSLFGSKGKDSDSDSDSDSDEEDGKKKRK